MSESTAPSTGAPTETTPARPGAGPAGRPDLGWTELVIGVVGYLGLSILVGLLLTYATGGAPLPTVAVVAFTGLATLAAAALALSARVRSLAAIGLRRTSLRWVLIGVAAGVGAYLVNRLVVLAYVALSGDTANPQQDLATSAAAPGLELLWLVLAGAVLVPFAEELLFRGIGYGALRRFGVPVATIVSAVLFGLAHGVNVVLPAAILLGALNALLYERSRSIWPAVIAHGINNAIVFGAAAILL